MLLKASVAALALVLVIQAAKAATPEPVRRIPVFVQPYYAAGRTPEERPKVEVGRAFDHALASTTAPDIVEARDAIAAKPGTVTTMTMMVLAIRLYDVGLRDDAVFWFYAAKARTITLEAAVDVSAPALASASLAMKNFATLAGPYINSYAFCDPAKQNAAIVAAVDWVEKHPYDVIFMDRVTAKPGDRAANVAQSLKRQRASAADERAKFNDPKFVAQFAAARKKNKTDAMFCWK
jgi:hypothetical protein